jgi:hypothetical protein
VHLAAGEGIAHEKPVLPRNRITANKSAWRLYIRR